MIIGINGRSINQTTCIRILLYIYVHLSVILRCLVLWRVSDEKSFQNVSAFSSYSHVCAYWLSRSVSAASQPLHYESLFSDIEKANLESVLLFL